MTGLAGLLAMLVPVVAGYALGRFAIGPRLPAGSARRLLAVAALLIGGILLWGGVGTAQAGGTAPALAGLSFAGVALGVASAAFRPAGR